MGGKSSKEENWERGSGSSFRSTSSSYPQSAYDRGQNYEPQQSFSSQQYYIPPPQNYGQQPPPPSYGQQPPPHNYGHESYATGRSTGDNRNKLERRYSRIADNYNSLDQVRDALILKVYLKYLALKRL